MKNINIVLLVTAIVISTVITNAKAQKGFYVSTQAAPQLGVMFNEDDIRDSRSDYKFKSSRTIGIGTGYNFRSDMGVGTEFMYNTLKQQYINGDIHFTQQFTYLKIPVFFTYNSNPNALVMFTAKAGPQLGILLKSSINNASDVNLNGSTKDKYQSVTGGVMIGAGSSLNLTNSVCLNLGLHFDGTFTNTEKTNYQSYGHSRAQTYLLNAGIELGIKYLIN
jgi:hypothetical protein